MEPKDETKDGVIPVKVAIRVRPLSEKEKLERSAQCVSFVNGEPQIIIGKDRAFTYDFVFPLDTHQSNIFSTSVEPLLNNCFEGFNVTILAYGQTGSGKTFTMGSGNNTHVPQHNYGIIPRVIESIYDRIKEDEGKISYSIKVSFLELYNEEIRDMLNSDVSGQVLQIREDTSKGIYVYGLTEEAVKSRQELANALIRGSLYRTTGSTLMNSESSRSHAIFSIIIQQKKVTQEPSATNDVITSKFHFVDLAGSERIKRTGAEGQRLKEGININQGLLALGNVISALADDKRKSKHIPYRDSKLTRLLQDSLGGNSRTLMIACCSPADTNFEETLNTLKYADRARQIKNKPVVNMDPTMVELQNLRKQVQVLQVELAKLRGEDPSAIASLDFESSLVSSDQVVKLNERIKQLEFENKYLDDSLKKSQTKVSEFMTRCVKLESERELDMIKYNAGNSNEAFDTLYQEQMQGHLKTIAELNSKLSDAQSELNKTKEKLEKAALKRVKEKYFAKAIPSLKEPSDVTSLISSPDVSSRAESLTSVDTSSEISSPPQSRSPTQEVNTSSDNSDDEIEDEETDLEYREVQSRMNAEINNLEHDIQLKEGLIKSLYQNREEFDSIKMKYDVKLKTLEHEVNKLKSERDKILKQMETQHELTEEQKIKIRKEYEEKMSRLNEQVGALRKQQKEHERLVKLQNRSEEKITILESDILKMKKQKVDLMKKLKEESKSYMEWKKEHNRELARLKRESAKQEKAIHELTVKSQHQDALLQRRNEELQASQRKLKENAPPPVNLNSSLSMETPFKVPANPKRASLKVPSAETPSSARPRSSSLSSSAKRPATVATETPQSSSVASGLTLAASPMLPPARRMSASSSGLLSKLKNEVAKSLSKAEARERLDKELEKRETLVKEIEQLQAKLNTPDFIQDEAELQELVSAVETLEVSIEYQNDKISKVQKELLIADEVNDSIFSRLESISVLDTRSLLRSTFDMLIRARSEERVWSSKFSQSQAKVMDFTKQLEETRQMNKEYHSRLLIAQATIEKSKLSLMKMNAHNADHDLLIDMDQFEQDIFNSPLPFHVSYTAPSIDPFSPVQESFREKLVVASTPLTSKPPPNLNSSLKFTNTESGADVFSRLASTRGVTPSYSGTMKNKLSTENSDCLKLQHTLVGHDGFVFHLESFNNSLFSASQDMVMLSPLGFANINEQKVKQWDIASLQEVRDFSGHQKAVQVVKLFKNNTGIVTGSKDKTIKIWSLETPEPIKTIPLTDEIHSLAVTDNMLFAGLGNGQIKVWDIQTWRLIKSLGNFHKGTIFSLFTTEKYLFSGSRDHSINVFTMDNLELVKKLHPPHYDGVNSFCLLPNSLLLSASRDKSIKVWNIANEEMPQDKIIHSAHSDWVNTLTYYNQSIYSGCRDGVISRWNSETFSQIGVFQAHTSSVNSLVTNPQFVISASNDRTIKIWKEAEQN